jgi:hypothetical protein
LRKRQHHAEANVGVTANFGLVLFRDYLLALILAQPAVLAKSVTKTSVTLGFFLPFAAHCTNGALFPADYCQAEQTPEQKVDPL